MIRDIFMLTKGFEFELSCEDVTILNLLERALSSIEINSCKKINDIFLQYY